MAFLFYMNKKYLFYVLFLSCNLAFAQGRSAFRLQEDTLRNLHQQILNDEDDSLKQIMQSRFKTKLMTVLAQQESMNFPFDSLQSIAVLGASDNSFRIFNWEIPYSDGSIAYEAIVQFYNPKKKQIDTVTLTDVSTLLKKPENQSLDAKNWYGAHYYKLIETVHKKKRTYTLLGANHSNPLLRKKLIDVIVIGKDGKLKFGESIFMQQKASSRRVIFYYSAEVSMSLRYDSERKMILFDHLVPRSPELKGQFEFYGPDMSIDGFLFKKGKWLYQDDVDARNEKRK